MQAERLVVGRDGDVGGRRGRAGKKRGDMGSEWLQRVGRLGVVVGEEQIADAIVQCIVQAALALEGVTLAQGTVLKQQLYNFIVAAETSLGRRRLPTRGQQRGRR